MRALEYLLTLDERARTFRVQTQLKKIELLAKQKVAAAVVETVPLEASLAARILAAIGDGDPDERPAIRFPSRGTHLPQLNSYTC
jgi:hypothetical protein